MYITRRIEKERLANLAFLIVLTVYRCCCCFVFFLLFFSFNRSCFHETLFIARACSAAVVIRPLSNSAITYVQTR